MVTIIALTCVFFGILEYFSYMSLLVDGTYLFGMYVHIMFDWSIYAARFFKPQNLQLCSVCMKKKQQRELTLNGKEFDLPFQS